MSIANQIRNAISSVSNPANWFVDLVGGSKTSSGVRMNGYSALTISTVWQAVRVISGDVGQLPLSRYKKNADDTRERSIDLLMEGKPNQLMTALKFKETLQAHALVYGNGYALIKRSGRKDPTELQILIPNNVTPYTTSENRLRYKVVTEVNGERKEKDYKSSDMLHIRGLGYDGLKGYSVITLAADCFGMTKASENHGGSYFRNFATPQGLLKMPGSKPKQEVIEQAKQDWKTLQGGENEHEIALMYGGMEFQPLAFTNVESQFLESREFQRTEIASWFNLPPHKVGDLSRATFTNIEEQNRDYLTTSRMYWLVTWQEECADKLLTKEQKLDGFYYEFNTAALLRGDTASRFEAYASGINNGWMSRNEARKMENMNPVDGLDEYLVPLNMAAAGQEVEEDGVTVTEDPEDDTNEDIISAAVTGIVRMEGNRITKSSETAKNFNSTVEKFYDQFSDKLWEVIEPLGATVATLDLYIMESKNHWSELSGTCNQEELHSVISEANSRWDGRAEHLAKLIIKDRENA